MLRSVSLHADSLHMQATVCIIVFADLNCYCMTKKSLQDEMCLFIMSLDRIINEVRHIH